VSRPGRPPALASSRLRQANPLAWADAVHLRERGSCQPPTRARAARTPDGEMSFRTNVSGDQNYGTIRLWAAAVPREAGTTSMPWEMANPSAALTANSWLAILPSRKNRARLRHRLSFKA